jgi:hypothetical protein
VTRRPGSTPAGRDEGTPTMHPPTITPTAAGGLPLTAGQADHLVALVSDLSAAALQRGRALARTDLSEAQRDEVYGIWARATDAVYAAIRDLERPAGPGRDRHVHDGQASGGDLLAARVPRPWDDDPEPAAEKAYTDAYPAAGVVDDTDAVELDEADGADGGRRGCRWCGTQPVGAEGLCGFCRGDVAEGRVIDPDAGSTTDTVLLGMSGLGIVFGAVGVLVGAWHLDPETVTAVLAILGAYGWLAARMHGICRACGHPGSPGDPLTVLRRPRVHTRHLPNIRASLRASRQAVEAARVEVPRSPITTPVAPAGTRSAVDPEAASPDCGHLLPAATDGQRPPCPCTAWGVDAFDGGPCEACRARPAFRIPLKAEHVGPRTHLLLCAACLWVVERRRAELDEAAGGAR